MTDKFNEEEIGESGEEEEIIEEEIAEEEVFEEEPPPVDEDPPPPPVDEAEEAFDEPVEEEFGQDEAVEENNSGENYSEDDYIEENPDEGFEDESYDEGDSDMGDEYTETEEEGWLSRIGSAITGILIGLLLFFVAFPVLFWNEGRSVKTYKGLKEGAGSVVSIPGDKVDSQYEGKLVHVSGPAKTDEILSDGGGQAEAKPISIKPDKVDSANEGKLVHITAHASGSGKIPDKDFGFSAKVIRLKRNVKMCQWKEVKKSNSNGTPFYAYKKIWTHELIDSSRFNQKTGHENPKSIPLKRKQWSVKTVKLGAFELSKDYIQKMNYFEPIVPDTTLARLSIPLKGKVKIYKNSYYIGKNPDSPAIGDIKVEYKAIKPGNISIIAMQKGNSFKPYQDSSGKQINILSSGRLDSDDMMPSGISVNAIKLKRSVEMYQWQEDKETKEEKKVGGKVVKKTTYKYKKVWSERLIDSSSFKKSSNHKNPQSMPLETEEFIASNVSLKAFKLSPSLIGSISNYEPFPVNSVSAAIPDRLRAKTKIENGGYYIGANSSSPKLGDLKVTYKVARPTDVSVIAKQSGSTFASYKFATGKSFQRLQVGTHTAEAMFEQAQSENTMLTWILRLVGFLIMFIGLRMIFKPISVIMDVIPLLGNIAETGLSVVSFLIAAAFATLTIAIAWFVYRPILSGILIAVCIGCIVSMKMISKKKKAAQAV